MRDAHGAAHRGKAAAKPLGPLDEALEPATHRAEDPAAQRLHLLHCLTRVRVAERAQDGLAWLG